MARSAEDLFENTWRDRSRDLVDRRARECGEDRDVNDGRELRRVGSGRRVGCGRSREDDSPERNAVRARGTGDGSNVVQLQKIVLASGKEMLLYGRR